MNDKLEYGETRKIEGTSKVAVDGILNNIDTAKIGMNHMAEKLKIAQKSLWDAVAEMFPETEEYHMTMDRKDDEDAHVIIIREKK